MSESMVERVAKAIDPVAFDPGYTGGPNGRAFRQDEARTKALAAIEAMREPTDAMIDAGLIGRRHDARDNFRAMIDAALKE
jgi:hypothetical protein